MYKIILLNLLCVALLCNCSNKGVSKFNKVEDMLAKDSIKLNTSRIIVYNDNSCEVCYQNLEYYIDHLPSKDFLFLYTSQSNKVTYERTVVKKFVRKDQFRLLLDKDLTEQLGKETNDYKGIYVINIADRYIVDIKPVNNF